MTPAQQVAHDKRKRWEKKRNLSLPVRRANRRQNINALAGTGANS